LPDRNSLALVINDWLHSSEHGDVACLGNCRAWDRKPHIGEYDTKTNAIRDFSQIPTASV
jgi:hypothetical protein